MGAKIESIRAREIIAQRGIVSLEVTVTTDDGAVGISTPETGVSTGKREATFRLDGGTRYNGRGVRQAAEGINQEIGPALKGMDVTHQMEIDRQMIELDGTADKSRLGANAIVGVSLAVIKAAACSAGLPLYRYIGGANACTLPIPIYGIGQGGRYRDPGTSRWFKPSYEFMAYGAGSYSNALEWSWKCADQTRRILRKRYPGTFTEQYRSLSLAGVIKEDRELLDVMTEAIIQSGYEGKVGIYFDVAADVYYEPDIDRYVGLFSPGEKTREQLIQTLKGFVEDFPVISLEDPVHEEDFEGYALAVKELGIEVVGDDFFTTNPERVRMAAAKGSGNSMVVKITQVGTVSEALEACRECISRGYNLHPCGSRGDQDSIGHFAVGLNAGQVRAVDHNQVLSIEEDLGREAIWPGRKFLKGWRNQA